MARVGRSRRRGMRVVARMLVLAAVVGAIAAQGCARVPHETAGPILRRKLTVDFTVAGRINPFYYYYVAIDTQGGGSDGPVPVVSFPWGNGWGTGTITHFVLYHLGNFTVFRFVPDTDLLRADPLGAPFEFNRPEDGQGNRIRVALDVDATLGENVNLIDLNIITTDRINIEPTFLGTKLVDALGFTGNDFVTLPLNITQAFTNAQGTDPEDAGDLPPGETPGVQKADLDITDWRVEMQINQ